ncbi:16S rRNA (adenine(1518)-N(6)/adenine(1519)-N(6))-dimethyltransferase RsmA [Risungbinella massiliensis]|uniref:16S rRNA (adenine(1518)-N(6)/adenine(1519)-N(6))- dimethyltransferase RsmA n=1 Tax=Risungbinella massiliensis TaxID=1329796 RepID=UPI0005CBB58C|nr:16S rRNA (adenine(1518)-N(6)/adenine(1519)-N(6))-dimethyltransferase RsmA [Risungbinella massiliensis]
MKKPISLRTKQVLKEHGLALKKSLGQNFLTDLNVLENIVDAAQLTDQSGVIEIGPGIGALTERLAQQAKKVVAVEIDQRLLPVLKRHFEEDANVTILHGDAMQVDFHQLITDQFADCDKVHVVANLPYYITTPILARLLEEKYPLHNIVIMIQKEVAERIVANPGKKDFGALSVLAQYYADVSWVTKVPSHVFVPQPKVDSAVIRLDIRQEPAVMVESEKRFFQIVRASFAQRRKTLSNALGSQVLQDRSKAEVNELLLEAGVEPSRRGETLTLEEFAKIADLSLRSKT